MICEKRCCVHWLINCNSKIRVKFLPNKKLLFGVMKIAPNSHFLFGKTLHADTKNDNA